MSILTAGSIVPIIVCLALVSSVACTVAPAANYTEQLCPDRLVIIEPQPGAPVRISLLKTNCQEPNFANVGFRTEATGAGRISQYEIRMHASHEGVTDSYSTVISGFGTLEPDDPAFHERQNSSETIGVTLARGRFKASVDELKLAVWSVTFADGTTWNRASVSK